MKSITVTELYTGKEYIFDNISRFTTIKTLKKVIQAKTHLDSKFQQLFYAHEFVRDDQLVHDLIDKAQRSDTNYLETFYLISTEAISSNSKSSSTLSTKPNFHFDSISMDAAVEWLQSAERIDNLRSSGQIDIIASILAEFVDYENIKVTIPSIEEKLENLPVEEAPEPLARAAAVNAVEAAGPVVSLLRLINIRALVAVLARFIIGCVFLYRGGGPWSPLKIAGAVAVLVFAYLVEVGIIGRLLHHLMELQMPRGVVDNGAPRRNIQQTLSHFLRNSLAVPQQPGRLLDIYALVTSFVLSLLPSWMPRGQQNNAADVLQQPVN